ncbi:alpha-N-acetylglucosaminidase TIM-barrel domain-containing protein [Fodinicola feengrottensis]|uniref:alpha-N-acetylglucosaminidase TIM-barrel domain-containing protein n=1 Tax=Fodinicola feengrottensis TaxID=435914 RepID=UPI0013D6F3B0|nr:alpha-N-acetylglucosaminidase TIM-barrel domain-containing protein [Fodinicola feengrottensis]
MSRRASQAVQRALETAHPAAIWAILGWQSNPLPATLQAVDRSKMLVLDGLSEQGSVTDRDQDWIGTPYAFGTIWNFGGHDNMGAGLAEWNRKFHAWQAKSGTALNGIALMPEGIDNNPVAVDFFAEMPWQDGPVDMASWFASYALARYGTADLHAAQAWQILGKTAYNLPTTVDGKYPTALYDDEPSITDTGAALGYDPNTFTPALGDLLQVAPRLRNSSAYRYDLVDVARQVLGQPKPCAAAAHPSRLRCQGHHEIRAVDRKVGAEHQVDGCPARH